MFITGYHGTTEEESQKILESNYFVPSEGEDNWLGNGIYFYSNLNDAYEWEKSEVILHTIIKINRDEFLDIDTNEGKQVFNNVLKTLYSYISKNIETSTFDFSNKKIIKNQCAVMNIIWDAYDELKVVAASFAKEKTKIKTLLDVRPRRREFCVKDNDCIVLIQKIRKGELNDRRK